MHGLGYSSSDGNFNIFYRHPTVDGPGFKRERPLIFVGAGPVVRMRSLFSFGLVISSRNVKSAKEWVTSAVLARESLKANVAIISRCTSCPFQALHSHDFHSALRDGCAAGTSLHAADRLHCRCLLLWLVTEHCVGQPLRRQ